MDNHSGKTGEAHVRKLLEEKGYRIVDSNFHSRFGEIDIIAENEKYIVFIEVKTRGETCLAHPLEAVTASKRQKIVKTALCYLSQHPTDLQPRFDVAGLVTDRDGNVLLSVSYLENAFDGV